MIQRRVISLLTRIVGADVGNVTEDASSRRELIRNRAAKAAEIVQKGYAEGVRGGSLKDVSNVGL